MRKSEIPSSLNFRSVSRNGQLLKRGRRGPDAREVLIIIFFFIHFLDFEVLFLVTKFQFSM